MAKASSGSERSLRDERGGVQIRTDLEIYSLGGGLAPGPASSEEEQASSKLFQWKYGRSYVVRLCEWEDQGVRGSS